MPSFAESFWTNDYSTGVNSLFEKLAQGCVENDEVLSLAAARAEAEEAYGARLKEITASSAVRKNGFGRDEGASLRKAYEGIANEMAEEGKNHLQVAENIRTMVLQPFGKWSDEHRQRVDYSRGVLKSKLRDYEKDSAEVTKCQKRYFNKCRVLDDYRASNPVSEGEADEKTLTSSDVPSAGRISDDAKSETTTVDETAKETSEHGSNMADDEDENGEDELIYIGNELYSKDKAAVLFKRALSEIPMNEIKVPILGTYSNVSTGAAIVSWLQRNLSNGSIQEAERIGQSLISQGYLRLVGSVGSTFANNPTFANSSVMNYQWKKQTLQLAGVVSSNRQSTTDKISPFVGEYIGETIGNYINKPHPDETQGERLAREVKELDDKYKSAVQKLDDTRCSLEEATVDHLTFMQRCEGDRLSAVKAVMLDFLAALSNVVPAIKASVDKLILYQETINPDNDLRYILESYRAGLFSPKVTIYDNYYNVSEDQTFGVDLELKRRVDHKKVPLIVSSILKYMDHLYPEMENDEARLGCWTKSVPLKTTHKLRRKLNKGPISPEVLTTSDPAVIASVLKLYLIELPDSVVPSQHYGVIKSIYYQHGSDENPSERIKLLQRTFSQFRVSNIATLDVITAHLCRLTSIANASQEYISKLAQELSYCILRPKTQSSVTIGDRHAFRLVQDLIVYNERIFADLKRKNSNQSKVSRNSSVTNGTDGVTRSLKSYQLSDDPAPDSPVLEQGQDGEQSDGSSAQTAIVVD